MIQHGIDFLRRSFVTTTNPHFFVSPNEGFECRCGGLYCSVHRYSDKHECSFNYRELGAEEIRRNNPVVVGQKIQKIWANRFSVYVLCDEESTKTNPKRWLQQQAASLSINTKQKPSSFFCPFFFFCVFQSRAAHSRPDFPPSFFVKIFSPERKRVGFLRLLKKKTIKKQKIQA